MYSHVKLPNAICRLRGNWRRIWTRDSSLKRNKRVITLERAYSCGDCLLPSVLWELFPLFWPCAFEVRCVWPYVQNCPEGTHPATDAVICCFNLPSGLGPRTCSQLMFGLTYVTHAQSPCDLCWDTMKRLYMSLVDAHTFEFSWSSACCTQIL